MPYVDIERDVLPTVARLNGPAMEVALGFDLHACNGYHRFRHCRSCAGSRLGSGANVHLNYKRPAVLSRRTIYVQKG